MSRQEAFQRLTKACRTERGVGLSNLPSPPQPGCDPYLCNRGAVMLRTGLALALCLSASGASAQQWAEKMFNERAFDFGTVAKAGKVEHQFVITNLYKDDVH